MMIRMKNIRFLNAIHVGNGTTFHLKETEWEMHLRDGVIWCRAKRPNTAGERVVRGFSWNNVVSVEPVWDDVIELFDEDAPPPAAMIPDPPVYLQTVKPALERKPRRRMVRRQEEMNSGTESTSGDGSGAE